MNSGAGTCDVYVNQAGNGSYSPANTVTYYVNATTASQTITFPNPGTQTYGAGSITLTATANSGLAVTYTVVSGPATVSGSTLTITVVGTVDCKPVREATATTQRRLRCRIPSGKYGGDERCPDFHSESVDL